MTTYELVNNKELLTQLSIIKEIQESPLDLEFLDPNTNSLKGMIFSL